MDKHIIGENAGILWCLLNTDAQKRWEYSEIKNITGFDDSELGSAIGWLAREDKIQFELEHHQSKDKSAHIYLMLNVYY
ncbi:winged helix-turn-helix domain-containing protein [Bacteroides finegoldii]|uniref:winged helix-turn-helix domain-containing protein n=1 Tax=Bacteroides finegoldii TaxID=338188 RepID=UPI0032EC6CCA